MSTIISIHSFRGGTGKSNVAANLAYLYAKRGKRVGIVDTDVQSPGVHAIFGLSAASIDHSLNDYLLGRTTIDKVAYALGERRDPTHTYLAGLPLWLIPSSIQPSEIAKVLHDGYDVNLLNDGFYTLIESLGLDVLIIDTHPGLNEETLLSIAVSDALCIIMRPDEQDYQGTAVTVDIARKLEVPLAYIVINKVPSRYDTEQLRQDVAASYDVPIAAVLGLSEDVAANASSQVFVALHPDHSWSRSVAQIADALLPHP